MNDVINLIREAAQESKSFENHAAKGLSLEERLLYLQGLALVMNAGGEVHDKKKDYLLILIKSLDLDESIIDSCIDFASQPDKRTIQTILKCFKRKPIAQLFLFDALMMSFCDGDISAQEKDIMDELAFQFEVAKGIYSDIFDLFCYIKNKNWQDSSLYFSTHSLNPKHFTHIFNYYDVDLDKLSNECNNTSKRRVLAFINRKIEDGLSNEDILPILQSKIDRREASVQNGIYISSDLGDVNISSLGISYNRLDETLYTDYYCLVKDDSIVNQFLNGVEITEPDRYKLSNGSKKIITSRVARNKRILKLDEAIFDGDLININGFLWEYKKLRAKKNIVEKKYLVSNTNRNFEQLTDLVKLQLHFSLTDKSNYGNLIRFYK
ncbi:tellurite resistance TerB family protein [Vibrio parahaemolyticus]|uniref:tellurite resistance TerB family protein n=1 Tax=Vibrio parahaemolyticus TaxID=670 RepID=UPI00040C4D13|nr:tellurite resistance TerB family protein [Vibrio parahaemolyticus]